MTRFSSSAWILQSCSVVFLRHLKLWKPEDQYKFAKLALFFSLVSTATQKSFMTHGLLHTCIPIYVFLLKVWYVIRVIVVSEITSFNEDLFSLWTLSTPLSFSLSVSLPLCHLLMSDVSVSQGLSKSKCVFLWERARVFDVYVRALYLVEPALC